MYITTVLVIADLVVTCHIYVKSYIYTTYVPIQPCGLITYMSHIRKKLHKCYIYVLIHPHGFTYMSHICTYIYIYVTIYMWTGVTYVTYMSHIGKGSHGE